MSESHSPAPARPAGARGFLKPMRARSPDEPHRTATPLELLFDLCSSWPSPRPASGCITTLPRARVDGLSGYLMVFFAIWWAWMNFTWFASAYDCDDVPYRLAVFVQITGALILAAGVPAMFEARSFTGDRSSATSSCGCLVRPVAACRDGGPERRTTAGATRGVALVQLAWIGLLFVPRLVVPGFLCWRWPNCSVPVVGRAGAPDHLAPAPHRRTVRAVHPDRPGRDHPRRDRRHPIGARQRRVTSTLLPLVVGGLLIVFSMWWIYFDRPVHDLLTSMRPPSSGATATIWSSPRPRPSAPGWRLSSTR